MSRDPNSAAAAATRAALDRPVMITGRPGGRFPASQHSPGYSQVSQSPAARMVWTLTATAGGGLAAAQSAQRRRSSSRYQYTFGTAATPAAANSAAASSDRRMLIRCSARGWFPYPEEVGGSPRSQPRAA